MSADPWPHIREAEFRADEGEWLASIAHALIALAISDAIIHDPASTVEAVARADQVLGRLPRRPIPVPDLVPLRRHDRGEPDVPPGPRDAS
ncbi:hypothetical protein [Actinomadura rupiterrae]|uniref:hypothetical protein n=1 Tax=Actinomadura rupiterrae TaxID=559627 RepID=UPI0020A295B8|nr:hypothetical protein [Actinomadura rupiterrae]MCP2339220.1 hypothetical protein [Actinomadura rupiterrae]